MYREEEEKISDYISVLMQKSESDFFRCLRVTKKTFNYLVQCLEQTDRFKTPKSTGTSAETAVAVTLWYFGHLSTQRDIARRFRFTHGHVCRLVKYVVEYLCSIAKRVIKWPDVGDLLRVEGDFKKLANFPDVLGAIGCCHVSIQAPEHCDHDYLHWHHNQTVHLLAVCDSSKKFTHCFAGYPGSVHDQEVFAKSMLGKMTAACSPRHFPNARYHIVGDSAFQLHQHVMVPYTDTGDLSAQELCFNHKLSQTRHVIESAFLFLKARFPRLRQLDCKLSRVSESIVACCVLHNLTITDSTEVDLLVNMGNFNESDLEPTGIQAPKPKHDLTTAKQKRYTLSQQLLQPC